MNLVTDREHNSGLTVRFGIQKMNASLSQIFASQKHRKTAMLYAIKKSLFFLKKSAKFIYT